MMVRRLLTTVTLTVSLSATAVPGVGFAAEAGTRAETFAASLPADPMPECNGANAINCWEYYSWYWTYAACHDAGRSQLAAEPRRYDDYNCAGGHGLVVWLWLHRRA